LTDVTHDEVDDGFHEIHLSGKQLFALFMATVVVSVVIFLIGVFVGRNVRTQQALAAERLNDSAAALAPAPVRQPAPAPAASESALEAAEPPTPPAETDELSYKRRLEGPSSSESLKTPAAAPAAPPVPRPAPAQATQTRAAAPAPAPQADAAGTIGTPRPGTWVIQIHVLRDRTAANGIVRRLSGKGYPAFLVAAGPPTGSYKIQVGRYRDRNEAQKVIDRLKKEEQFNPWITR
jgi:cell division septation protein DedD